MEVTDSHDAPVSCAAASPDGRVYASGGYDRRVLLWDARSGDVLRELRGHDSLVNGLAWSPDGSVVASASSDHSARLWHALTGRELTRLEGHTDDVNCVRFSPDGSRVATASFDGAIRVFDRQGACRLVAQHHASDTNGVAWLPCGTRLASASDDGRVAIFDAETGRVRRFLEGHDDWVDQVAVHPDGMVLASASLDGSVGVWELNSGRSLARLDASTCVVKDVAFSRDGSRLAATSYDGCVRIYAFGSWQLLEQRYAEGLWNRTIDFTDAGVLTGSFGGGPVLLERAGARRFGADATRGINGFALCPDGRFAFAGSDDGALYEVDLDSGRCLGVLARHDAAVLCVAVSADGQRIATGSWDRSVRVWDRSGRCIARWAGSGDPINALAFAPDGRSLWIGTFNGEVLRWSTASEPARLIGRHHGSVKNLTATPEGAVSVGRDGRVMRWSASGEAGAFRAGPSILNGVAADRGGRLATVSRRAGAELWSGDGQALGAFRDHACSAKTVAFSADDERVAVGYYDGYVALWDPARRMGRAEKLCEASISQVAFAPSRLIVSAWDTEGSLYTLDSDGRRLQRIPVAA